MKFLEPIKDFFIAYYDKLVLGVVLICLAVVAMSKAMDMRTTRDQISEINKKIQDFLPEGVLEQQEFENKNVHIPFRAERRWATDYLPGPWSRAVIRDMQAIRRTALAQWLEEHAEGSLFDPMVYVYSINYTPYILHWDTERHPWTGTPQPPFPPDDRPPPPPEDDDDDDDDDDDTDREWVPPARFVRIADVGYPNLPFVLKLVEIRDPDDLDTWRAQINVYAGGRTRTQLVRQGERIPGTRFRLIRIQPDQTDDRRSTVLVEKVGEDGMAIGEEREMQIDKPLKRSEPVFLFRYLYDLSKAVGEDGELVRFKGSDGNVYTYRVIVNDQQPSLQLLGRDGEARGSAEPIQNAEPNEFRQRYQEILRERREARQRELEERNREGMPDPGMMGPEMDPAMDPNMFAPGAPPPEPRGGRR